MGRVSAPTQATRQWAYPGGFDDNRRRPWADLLHVTDPDADPYGFARFVCGRTAPDGWYYRTDPDLVDSAARDNLTPRLCGKCLKLTGGDPPKGTVVG